MRNTKTPGYVVTRRQVHNLLVGKIESLLAVLIDPLVRHDAVDRDLLLREKVQRPECVGPAHTAGVGDDDGAGGLGDLQGDADYS